MPWTSTAENLDVNTTRTKLSAHSRSLSFAEVLKLWRDDDDFRRFFTSLLTPSPSPLNAYFWETPPLTVANVNREYEHVTVIASSLTQLQPEPHVFSEKFQEQPSARVVTFSNLGGDATLVVPAPLNNSSDYTHLAQFLRSAPADQSSELWRCVEVAVQKRLSSNPVWISTAGMGVSWLHVRLDSRPKYYRHDPYKFI